MPHNHTHTTASNERVLKIAFFIIFSFMIIEVVGGLLSNSLALLADAGHMLTDAIALGMAWLAFVIGRKPPDREHSYGHNRYQVLAAFVNGLFLILVVVFICFEAFERFIEPPTIDAPIMLLVATAGLIVNIVTFWMLHNGDSDNLNIRGAIAHVLSDLLGSVAAILAGVGILLWQWYWLDPVLSLLVALLILRSGILLIRDSSHVLLEGVPKALSIVEVKKTILAKHSNVDDVHHVHIWSITEDDIILTLHVRLKDLDDYDATLEALHQTLAAQFKIRHATIQIEKTFCSSQHIETEEAYAIE